MYHILIYCRSPATDWLNLRGEDLDGYDERCARSPSVDEDIEGVDMREDDALHGEDMLPEGDEL